MNSWLPSANNGKTHFPLQNLPFGVFSLHKTSPRCGVAIGDFVLDLAVLEEAGLLGLSSPGKIFTQPALNEFMALGPENWMQLRERLTELLAENGCSTLKDDVALKSRALHARSDITMHLPFRISEFTDFYSSRHHAFNVGSMFRGPDNALPPNWLHMPIAYNGRASTVIISGTDIHRPHGQLAPKETALPTFGPSQRLDFELEIGVVIGQASHFGQPVNVAESDEMIFGYVLLNDWSARDIQAWEYQPLGPFQAKAFATTISPWIVTKTALEPFRTTTPPREQELLPYLREPGPMAYDIALEVLMQPDHARKASLIARSNYKHQYYSPAQQLAHHTASGCAMNIGDLLGSGTISGPDKGEFGSLLELSWGGRKAVILETGEERRFIEDGDQVILTGWAEGNGHRIGFGKCTGRILPAIPFANP